MRNPLLLLGLLLAGLLCGDARPLPAAGVRHAFEPPRTYDGVLGQLQGEWRAVMVEHNEVVAVGGNFKNWGFGIRADRLFSPGKSGKSWVIELDLTDDPHRATFTSGKERIFGIFRIEGKDLKLCYRNEDPQAPNRRHPTTFTTGKQDGRINLILVRDHPPLR